MLAAFLQFSKNRQRLSQKIEISVFIFFVLSLGIVLFLSIAFLWHSNSVATKGYLIENLRIERENLLQKNEILSMQLADLQSLGNFENDPIVQEMVKVNYPKYIRGDTAVAQVDSKSNEF